MNEPQIQPPNEQFWKRKLAAFLHDSPSKCLDIASHEERSKTAFIRAGFTDNEIGFYDVTADHQTASADRFPFPDSKKSGIRCTFDGLHNGFRHPLCGGVLHFDPFPSAAFGEEIEQMTQPSDEIIIPTEWSESDKWRARYFSQWRLWWSRLRELSHLQS